MPKAKTYFASPERLGKIEIKKQSKKILSLKHTEEILNAFPSVVVVLNKHRQVIFANNSLINMFGIDNFEEALGQRPGELLKCVNANLLDGGCGTSRNCRYCGAILTVLKAQKTNEEQESEARITTRQQSKIFPYDLHVIAKPMLIDKEQFIVVIMTDISIMKRKEYLERTFMHDIINSKFPSKKYFCFGRIKILSSSSSSYSLFSIIILPLPFETKINSLTMSFVTLPESGYLPLILTNATFMFLLFIGYS